MQKNCGLPSQVANETMHASGGVDFSLFILQKRIIMNFKPLQVLSTTLVHQFSTYKGNYRSISWSQSHTIQ